MECFLEAFFSPFHTHFVEQFNQAKASFIIWLSLIPTVVPDILGNRSFKVFQRKRCQLFIRFYVMIWENWPWFTCAIRDFIKGMNEHFSIAPLSKTSKASRSLFPVSILEKIGKNINWIVDYIDRSRAILNALPCLINTCSLTPVFKKAPLHDFFPI